MLALLVKFAIFDIINHISMLSKVSLASSISNIMTAVIVARILHLFSHISPSGTGPDKYSYHCYYYNYDCCSYYYVCSYSD